MKVFEATTKAIEISQEAGGPRQWLISEGIDINEFRHFVEGLQKKASNTEKKISGFPISESTIGAAFQVGYVLGRNSSS